MARPCAFDHAAQSSSPTRSHRAEPTNRTRFPWRTPLSAAEGIEQRERIAKTDHLGAERAAGVPLDFDLRSDRRGKIGDRGRHAERAHDAAREGGRHQAIELHQQVLHDDLRRFRVRPASVRFPA